MVEKARNRTQPSSRKTKKEAWGRSGHTLPQTNKEGLAAHSQNNSPRSLTSVLFFSCSSLFSFHFPFSYLPFSFFLLVIYLNLLTAIFYHYNHTNTLHFYPRKNIYKMNISLLTSLFRFPYFWAEYCRRRSGSFPEKLHIFSFLRRCDAVCSSVSEAHGGWQVNYLAGK